MARAETAAKAGVEERGQRNGEKMPRSKAILLSFFTPSHLVEVVAWAPRGHLVEVVAWYLVEVELVPC